MNVTSFPFHARLLESHVDSTLSHCFLETTSRQICQEGDVSGPSVNFRFARNMVNLCAMVFGERCSQLDRRPYCSAPLKVEHLRSFLAVLEDCFVLPPILFVTVTGLLNALSLRASW